MAKLREAINQTKELARAADAYCQNGTKGPSFEKGWNVENCAEVWSCRQAILRGVKFEDMEMYCLHGGSGQEAPPCRNCKKTFKQIIERMKEDKYKPEIDENNPDE